MPAAPTRIDGITAVVCNYNGESYLEECIRSVKSQEGVSEIIVVDDASSDASLAVLAELFPEVRVIQQLENAGPCVARNAGMRAARHRFVLAVDNDAVLRPGVVARLKGALEDRPRCAVAMVRSVIYEDPDRIHYDSGDFHYVGLLSLRNFHTPLRDVGEPRIVETSALIGICALMDRDAVLLAGGYDEEFFYLAEDYELSYRLRALGETLVSVEDAIVLHRGGTAGLSFRGGGYPERRAYLHARNRMWILLKCYRWRTLLCALPGILLYELVWLAFTVKTGHLRVGLAGKFAALRSLSRMLEKRRTLQRNRSVSDRELLVGGPLTFSPSLLSSGPARAGARALDASLRTWWFLVRPFVG